MKHSREEHGPGGEINLEVLWGVCRVDPAWVETTGNHGCSKYTDAYIREPRNIANHLCGRTWERRDALEIKEKIEKLKRQVAHHKRLSAARWKRLKKMKE